MSGVSLDAATHLLHTNPDARPLAHLGDATTTFLGQHAGHGQADLTGLEHLPNPPGWFAQCAFAKPRWDADCLLVVPTAFRTAMSKMAVSNQLPMPVADGASTSVVLPEDAERVIGAGDGAASAVFTSAGGGAASVVVTSAGDANASAPPPGVADAGDEAFKVGDFFTLKSNTKAQVFGAFYTTQGNADDSRPTTMLANGTEVTLTSNVRLEFMEYQGESVKIKQTLNFQETISKVSAPNKSVPTSTLYRGFLKAYNAGAYLACMHAPSQPASMLLVCSFQGSAAG